MSGSHFFTTPKSPKFTTTKFSCLMQQTFSPGRCCKNQFSRGVSAEGATSKIGSKSASCSGIYDRDTFFNFTKTLTNRFNNVCNPPGISMITTSGRLANFIQFHTISQQKFTKPKELERFQQCQLFSFFQIWCPVKMHIQVCGAWPTWFQDVVSLSNRAGSWVWVKQKALYKIFPPTKWGRKP